MLRLRHGIILLFIAVAGCAHFATQQEKAASFEPFERNRIGEQLLGDYIEQRTAFLVAGAKPLNAHMHHGIVDLAPTNPDGKIDLSSAAAIAADGYFLTAAHCIRRKPVFLVVFTARGPQSLAARVVWQPRDSNDCDLAILKVNASLPGVFELAGDSEMRAGSGVVTSGANGEAGGRLIKATRNEVKPGADVPRTYRLLHDVPLTLGDSGGPLTTLQGKLLGVEVLVQGVYIGPRQGVALRAEGDWMREVMRRDRMGGSK